MHKLSMVDLRVGFYFNVTHIFDYQVYRSPSRSKHQEQICSCICLFNPFMRLSGPMKDLYEALQNDKFKKALLFFFQKQTII